MAKIGLVNKTQKENTNIKSKELAKVELGKFTMNDFEIEVIGDIKEIEGGIELFAKAWKNGKQLGFGKDGTIDIERFRIFNPPVLVDDQNGEIVRDLTDIDTKELKQRKLKYDPAEAIRQSLENTIRLVGKEDTKIIEGKIGNTTSTFYSTAQDAALYREHKSESWSTIKENATGTKNSSAAYGAVAMQPEASSNLWKGLYRAGFPFDTSSLNGQVVSSATFSVYGYLEQDTGGYGIEMNIYSFTPTNIDATSGTDYYYTHFGTTAFSSSKNLAAYSTSGYNDFTLNASGIASISVVGEKTGFGTREPTYDAGSTTPSWQSGQPSSYMWCYYSEETATTKDPKLVVEHEEGATTTNFFNFIN